MAESRSGLLHSVRHSRSVGLLRYHLYRDVLLSRPRRRACNICGWQGRRFLTYLHRHVLCPKCGSHVRHRLIAASARQLPEIMRRLPVDGADVLHISPEYCLSLVFQPLARRYVRADYGALACDVRQDIRRMPFADATFDTVVACDVLEHVEDDRLALTEIRRVLQPWGCAVLTVPQSDSAYQTYEDAAIRTQEDRWREYGQPDHVRNYGADFPDRVRAIGFDVIEINRHAFREADVQRNVLQPPLALDESWGWNERRVQFAFKV